MAPIGVAWAAEPLVAELDQHPDMWNEYRFRTANPKSPHREADDIWLRYNPVENLDPSDLQAFNEEHVAQWYPAADKTPLLRSITEQLAFFLGAMTIGAVLVTRVPPGKQVYPHVDGGWHAKAHRKFLLLLRGNPEQTFWFKDETMSSSPGEVFEFQNEYPHAVLNPTNEERISMIICLRNFAGEP